MANPNFSSSIWLLEQLPDPQVLHPPSHRGMADRLPALPPATEVGDVSWSLWGTFDAQWCAEQLCAWLGVTSCPPSPARLPHLSGRAEAAVSSMVWPWAVPCKAGVHSLTAQPLCWIRRKCISEVGLLRRRRAGRVGRMGRASCCGGACPAGQTDDVKSLDRQASCDQTEQNYLQMQKIKACQGKREHRRDKELSISLLSGRASGQ